MIETTSYSEISNLGWLCLLQRWSSWVGCQTWKTSITFSSHWSWILDLIDWNSWRIIVLLRLCKCLLFLGGRIFWLHLQF